MRILLAVPFVAFCLALVGCSTPSRGGGLFSRSTSTGGREQQPFLGLPPSSSPGTTAETGNLTSSGPGRQEGVLAGRILDQDNKLRPGAIIQVIDLESIRSGAAPLSVLANRDGYFDIGGLATGRSYRLLARVKDGSRTLSGSARVVPPNVRVAIFLTDEAPAEGATADAATPVPGDTPGAKTSSPAATLGPPIKNPGAGSGVTTPLPSTNEGASGSAAPAVSTTDSSLTATIPGRESSNEKPAATIPIPPPPGASSEDRPPPPPGVSEPVPAPPSGSASAEIPVTKTVVPSCLAVGNRIENFALYDVKGNTFEFAKDRKGKLILLDFWFTGCLPCRQAIPKLNALQAKYQRHGLEVIGITYEQGTLEEKQQTLEQARRRHGLSFNYRLLFGGGGERRCPVADRFELHRYPTLVLLDEEGRILHRCQGLDPQSAYELEMTIYRKLISRSVAGR